MLTPVRRKPFVRWMLQRYWRLQRGLTLGGQMCVIDAQGHVLLVRHGYQPGWQFPGGGVERGENVRDAAIRELEEETGLVAREEPKLHGIFDNAAIFPGDHVVLFVLRAFERIRTPPPTFEIQEQGFFAPDALPPATSEGTKRRIREILEGVPVVTHW